MIYGILALVTTMALLMWLEYGAASAFLLLARFGDWLIALGRWWRTSMVAAAIWSKGRQDRNYAALMSKQPARLIEEEG